MTAATTIRSARKSLLSWLSINCETTVGILTVLLVLVAVPASAQVAPIGEKSMGDSAGSKLPVILQKATIDQHLDQSLPLGAEFRDETGRTVHLGDYFGQKPAILALVYYRCPMLCSEELNGLVGALEMLKFTPGKDFNVIVASFDPREGPALAASVKEIGRAHV